MPAIMILPIMANHQNQQKVITMFTLTIESQDGLEKSIREWPTCDIFAFGSAQFDEFMKSELERLKTMFRSPKDPDPMELVQQYKAVLRSVCGEYDYYLTHDQAAYVTNSNGKTVAVVK